MLRKIIPRPSKSLLFPRGQMVLLAKRKSQKILNKEEISWPDIFFFNVMASGGLYIFVYWTQLLEYWPHNGITYSHL